MANPELTDEQKRQQFEAACKAKPLKDQLSSLRAIEGFPIGTDEDILALSDPPYYTACPNPYINDFIKAFGKPYDPATDDYERTPFVSDVSEGKDDPIYNAHSYHTKVPHKAIIPFIKHYTDEGDLLFDGFCGTGMTGIAAELINRNAILSDLSPAATFIASNYNSPMDGFEFEREVKKLLSSVQDECGWMYETRHVDGTTIGIINYVVWSDVFICPFCKQDYVLWDVAIDENDHNKVKDDFLCPNCNAQIKQNNCERLKIVNFDSNINKDVVQAKQVPVLINYSANGKRHEKIPDKYDLATIKKIDESKIPYLFPTNELPDGYNTNQPKLSHGFTHVHHFYSKRNLWVLASIYNKVLASKIRHKLIWDFTGIQNVSTKMNRYTPAGIFSKFRALIGTLYLGSMYGEMNIISMFKNKSRRLIKIAQKNKSEKVIISTQSNGNLINVESNSMDYIFTDPPFGGNLMYSELNFLWEAWLKVFTNNKSEAIINKNQSKDLPDYKELMTLCFKEMYRILKPNRWITVEFHNSKASVWNAIQDSLPKSGFIIAQVTILDKKHGSFKQVTTTGAVKNDLIINAYKPRQSFEERFLKRAGVDLEKEFVAEHLSHLPKEPNIERTEQMLFSKMLAHYIQHGYEIRLNARQFYSLLRDHFKLIDGYWLLDKEIAKYEEWKKVNGLQAIEAIAKGQQTLFVTDERSFLIWLYNFLATPKTYGEVFTASRNILSSSSEIIDQIPEPKLLLEINFIFEDGKYRRPTTDTEHESVETRRERELQKSFEKIFELALRGTKKIKDVRKEAVAYGFTKAYQEKRFADIITVAKKLDKKILENNSEINDFVEIAELKLGAN